jgi:hypothetical protein
MRWKADPVLQMLNSVCAANTTFPSVMMAVAVMGLVEAFSSLGEQNSGLSSLSNLGSVSGLVVD